EIVMNTLNYSVGGRQADCEPQVINPISMY
ncbi:MAG: hypothetical protein ACI9UU_003831, partial [Candidatus Azotimanducaceae bacterium]